MRNKIINFIILANIIAITILLSSCTKRTSAENNVDGSIQCAPNVGQSNSMICGAEIKLFNQLILESPIERIVTSQSELSIDQYDIKWSLISSNGNMIDIGGDATRAKQQNAGLSILCPSDLGCTANSNPTGFIAENGDTIKVTATGSIVNNGVRTPILYNKTFNVGYPLIKPIIESLSANRDDVTISLQNKNDYSDESKARIILPDIQSGSIDANYDASNGIIKFKSPVSGHDLGFKLVMCQSGTCSDPVPFNVTLISNNQNLEVTSQTFDKTNWSQKFDANIIDSNSNSANSIGNSDAYEWFVLPGGIDDSTTNEKVDSCDGMKTCNINFNILSNAVNLPKVKVKVAGVESAPIDVSTDISIDPNSLVNNISLDSSNPECNLFKCTSDPSTVTNVGPWTPEVRYYANTSAEKTEIYIGPDSKYTIDYSFTSLPNTAAELIALPSIKLDSLTGESITRYPSNAQNEITTTETVNKEYNPQPKYPTPTVSNTKNDTDNGDDIILTLSSSYPNGSIANMKYPDSSNVVHAQFISNNTVKFRSDEYGSQTFTLSVSDSNGNFESETTSFTANPKKPVKSVEYSLPNLDGDHEGWVGSSVEGIMKSTISGKKVIFTCEGDYRMSDKAPDVPENTNDAADKVQKNNVAIEYSAFSNIIKNGDIVYPEPASTTYRNDSPFPNQTDATCYTDDWWNN